jgi:HD-GYP domain-containing protein (c-di-GMP phosphodiesterase class II)
MAGAQAAGDERIRAAEVIASLCLATDLGMGFPFEHGLNATLATMRLCDALDVDAQTAAQTYYVSLLMYTGCTTDAEVAVRIFRGSMTASGTHRQFGSPLEAMAGGLGAVPSPESRWPRRAYETLTGLPGAAMFTRTHFAALCEVAEMLAERVGLPDAVSTLFHLLTERWDGKSVLRRAKQDEVPLPLRIVHVGRDAAYQRLMGDDDHVVAVIRSRAGHAFDPEVAGVFVKNAAEILGTGPPESVWDEVLDTEPRPWLALPGDAIDRAVIAIGAFADLASPFLSGHSAGVGEIAGAAARLCGFDDTDVTAVRRAGHLHDVGRTAVHPRIWAKAGRLTADEWEQVRLHPYHTERIFAHSPSLAPFAAIGRDHHERLDGSGYHRGVGAAMLPPSCRLLAAADAYQSKIEPRPYRAARSPDEASAMLTDRARAGTLDTDMVAAVVEAAGHTRPRFDRPAGLTERETEVIGLLARGMQTKQIARALAISVKTADRHIQNVYGKIGVSTRAAATLFAVEHSLVPWGEFPIRRPDSRP